MMANTYKPKRVTSNLPAVQFRQVKRSVRYLHAPTSFYINTNKGETMLFFPDKDKSDLMGWTKAPFILQTLYFTVPKTKQHFRLFLLSQEEAEMLLLYGAF